MAPEEVGPFLSKARRLLTDFSNFPVPTIAAMDGFALGGGMEWALSSDIRVAGAFPFLGCICDTLAQYKCIYWVYPECFHQQLLFPALFAQAHICFGWTCRGLYDVCAFTSHVGNYDGVMLSCYIYDLAFSCLCFRVGVVVKHLRSPFSISCGFNNKEINKHQVKWK